MLSPFFNGLNYGLSVGNPENNSLLKKKTPKGDLKTKRNEDGEDCNRLEMTILKSLANLFKIHEQ